MSKNNNQWYFTAFVLFFTGGMCAAAGEWSGVIPCIFGIFMCCIHRELLNKYNKKTGMG